MKKIHKESFKKVSSPNQTGQAQLEMSKEFIARKKTP